MSSVPSSNALGFITIRMHAEHGYFGGLLCINPHGRPLEFHCTLPVKPTRAQTILYGPTLNDFVCGEQIARTLLARSKVQPLAVFVDSVAVLALRNLVSEPIVYVEESSKRETSTGPLMFPPDSSRELKSFRLGSTHVAVDTNYQDDIAQVSSIWKTHDPQIDLTEPFGRIAEALAEAHPNAKAA